MRQAVRGKGVMDGMQKKVTIQSDLRDASEKLHLEAIRAYWLKLDTTEKKVSCLNSFWVETDPISSCKALANLFSTMPIHEVLDLFPRMWLKIQAKFVTVIKETDMNEFMSLLPYQAAARICWMLEQWKDEHVKNFDFYKKFCADFQDAAAEEAILQSEKVKFETLCVTSMRDELIAAVSGLVLDALDHLVATLTAWHDKTIRMKDKGKAEVHKGIIKCVTNAVDQLGFEKTRKGLLSNAQMIERNTILRYNAFASTEVWKEYDINGDVVFALMEEIKTHHEDTIHAAETNLTTYFAKTYSPSVASDCVLLKAYGMLMELLGTIINNYLKSGKLYDKANSINVSRLYIQQINSISTTAGRILSEMQIDKDVVNKKVHEIHDNYILNLLFFIKGEECDKYRKELRRDFLLWYICKYATGELKRPLGNKAELTHENYFLGKVLPYTLKGGMIEARFGKDIKKIRCFAMSKGIVKGDELKEAIAVGFDGKASKTVVEIEGKKVALPTVSKMLDKYADTFPGPTFTGHNAYFEKFIQYLENELTQR